MSQSESNAMIDPDRSMRHKRKATRNSLEVIMQKRLKSLSFSISLKWLYALKTSEGHKQVLKAFFWDFSEMLNSLPQSNNWHQMQSCISTKNPFKSLSRRNTSTSFILQDFMIPALKHYSSNALNM